jgi:hypothetical protein
MSKTLTPSSPEKFGDKEKFFIDRKAGTKKWKAARDKNIPCGSLFSLGLSIKRGRAIRSTACPVALAPRAILLIQRSADNIPKSIRMDEAI